MHFIGCAMNEGVTGLSSTEAAARLERSGYNELPAARRRGLLGLLLNVAQEPMIILLLACSLVYLLLGDLREGILLLGSVGVVVGIVLYQQARSERAIEALRDLSSPRALVIRDGVERRIPGREVVPGDFLVLREGDRVPADASLDECRHAEVDESLLTGESAPVPKRAGDRVFSGTLVVGGGGRARVELTGTETELGRIGRALEGAEQGQTALQREISRLVRVFGAVGIAASIAVAVFYGFASGDWVDGLLAGLAAAMSLLPDELPVILTIYLALGAWRTSKKNVLTRNVATTESLGSITVLCVDKTGTLTRNQMTVRELRAGEREHDLSAGPASSLPEPLHPLLEYGVLASQRDPFDPMEKAILAALRERLGGSDHVHADWRLVREYPLSEGLLAMSCVWESPSHDRRVIAAKGAPEAIADLCHLSRVEHERIAASVMEMGRRGLRVLGVAEAEAPEGELPSRQHDFELRFLGLIGLEDPLRPEVPAAVRECRSAGIRVIMMTGDHAETARSIARQAGLDDPEGVITGRELESLDDLELRRRIRRSCVFARALPAQKLRIVSALKANGEIVGMTGDGVNDAPSLKWADVGIAMGRRGTDVAREASDLVLLDDDFASIVAAIRMGRRILDNIRKAISYVFSIHVPIAGMAILPVALRLPSVLFPAHIVFLQLIIDPACSLVFESEAEEPDVMSRPPRSPDARLFGVIPLLRSTVIGAGVLALSLAIYVGLLRFGNAGHAATAAFAAIVLGNLGLIGGNLSRLGGNRALRWVTGVTIPLLAVAIYTPWVEPFFHFTPLSATEVLLCVGAGWVSLALARGLRSVLRPRA